MKVITLPNSLNIFSTSPIQIFDYQSSKEISKQRIILNQNTFSFLLEGTKEVLFDNSSLAINHAKFLLMKSGHCLMTEKLSETKNYRSLLFFFSNEALLAFVRKYDISRKDASINQSIFAFEYDRFLNSFVRSLRDISKLPKSTMSTLIHLKFEEVLLYLISVYGPDFLFSLLINSDSSSLQFKRTIEHNTLNKLTLKELAFLCNMSVSTFKRIFEKHYSESPIKWFQQKRLKHARYLIQKEQKGPSEIYNEIGYESLSSFIQAYKAAFGVTPKQHRQY